MVAWSWDLLSEQGQRAARRFTVFPAAATARAALEVCRAGGTPTPEPRESPEPSESPELVGAYVLAGELAAARGDHRTAFARYEREMRAYAEGCQKMGDGVAKLMVPGSRLHGRAARAPQPPFRRDGSNLTCVSAPTPHSSA
ncbi:hypothetical protein [Streptomyces sp. WAC06614]|uniref:hypothetical protein n=1 Tax=Streptomyces sp. WAC06614 TaxID=2487416 RepID=UPI000F7A5501|nr:hypothetical protein [Streptomyces sp. WAC06614]RSS79728.1 hypothetical protein EF918_16295 [Streptomyces sp. WAC06614]